MMTRRGSFYLVQSAYSSTSELSEIKICGMPLTHKNLVYELIREQHSIPMLFYKIGCDSFSATEDGVDQNVGLICSVYSSASEVFLYKCTNAQ